MTLHVVAFRALSTLDLGRTRPAPTSRNRCSFVRQRPAEVHGPARLTDLEKHRQRRDECATR